MKRWLTALLCVVPTGATTLIGGSRSRLPMSLSSVINDLEAEGVTHVTSACLLTSRGITRTQRKQLLHDLFGIFGGEDECSMTAFGTQPAEDDVEGLAIANPDPSMPATDVADTAVACAGTIIYVPHANDLKRGEGLFDTLAPAMERLVSNGVKASLIVIVTNDIDVDTAKANLEQAASSILQSLVFSQKRKASSLSDVFHTIHYHLQQDGPLDDLLHELDSQCDPAAALAAVASTVDLMTSFTSSLPAGFSASAPCLTSPDDLAAARQLGPAARQALATALETVKTATSNSPGGLVTEFADLCKAITARALSDLDQVSDKSSGVAKQIRSNLQEDIYAELGDSLDQQLKLLEAASFEDFRKDLSQLKVSPALSNDMNEVVQKSIAAFSKALKKMSVPGSSGTLQAAKTEFARTLQDYCAERLLAAKASGAYKPVPRKGVTVGFHWLLPKPFGNDFRQEPWKVHATDNLVYVPQDKITDVSPDEVRAGNWRRKIVPSPASREMVYMQ